MKFIVTFKNPDAIDQSLQNYLEIDQDRAKKFAERWVAWGEYIDVEFDTVKRTAVVLPANP